MSLENVQLAFMLRRVNVVNCGMSQAISSKHQSKLEGDRQTTNTCGERSHSSGGVRSCIHHLLGMFILYVPLVDTHLTVL